MQTPLLSCTVVYVLCTYLLSVLILQRVIGIIKWRLHLRSLLLIARSGNIHKHFIDRWLDEQINRLIDRWMDGWTDVRMDGYVGRQVGGCGVGR
jgi:hypothetical protein